MENFADFVENKPQHKAQHKFVYGEKQKQTIPEQCHLMLTLIGKEWKHIAIQGIEGMPIF